MVVKSAKGIWDVKSMVGGMKLLVKPFVYVHQSMKEILPCIDNEPSGSHGLSRDCKEEKKRIRTWQARTARVELPTSK